MSIGVERTQIIALLICGQLVAAQAFAGGGDACMPLCDQVNDAQHTLQTRCGASVPNPKRTASAGEQRELDALERDARRSTAFNRDNLSGDADYDRCVLGFYVEHSMIAPHCLAIKQSRDAQAYGYAILAFYGVAAGACAVACIMEKSPAYPAYKMACSIGAGVASVADLSSTTVFAVMGQDWVNSLASGLSAVGTGTLAVGTGVSAAQAIGDQVSANMASEAGKSLFPESCATAVILGGIGIAKAASIAMLPSTADHSCTELGKLGGFKTEFVQFGGVDDGGSPRTPSSVDQNKTPTTTSGRGGSGKSAPPAGSGAPVDLNNPNAVVASATASGNADSEFKKVFPNPERLPELIDLLKKEGLDPQAIGQQSAANGGGFAGLQGLPNLSDEQKEKLSELDKNARAQINAALQRSQAQTTRLGGGGKSGGGGAAANPFASLFGAKGAAGGKTAGTATFSAKQATGPADPASDIWHEGASASLFQIVSRKIEVNRARVDSLEWASPLNRALVGQKVKR